MCWFCSSETYVGLQYSDIFPKDYVVPKTRKNLILKNIETPDNFGMDMWSFKHKYRMLNQEKWSKKYNMDTYSDLITRKIDYDKLLKYVKGSVDKTAISITSANVTKIANATDIGNEYLSSKIEDDIANNTVIQENDKYKIEATSYDADTKEIEITVTNKSDSSTSNYTLPLERIDYKMVKHGDSIDRDQDKIVIRFLKEDCQDTVFKNPITNIQDGTQQKCPFAISFRGAGTNNENQQANDCGYGINSDNNNLSLRDRLNHYLIATTFSYNIGVAFFIEIDAVNSTGMSITYVSEYQDGTETKHKTKFTTLVPQATNEFVSIEKQKISPIIQIIKNGKSQTRYSANKPMSDCEEWEKNKDGVCADDCVRHSDCTNKDEFNRCPCKKNEDMIKYFKRFGLDIDNIIQTILVGSPPKEGEDPTPRSDDTAKSAFVFMSMPLLDPYLIEAGEYKASVAQNLPLQLLRKMDVKKDGKTYILHEKDSIWWKSKNKVKRRDYAKILLNTLKLYENQTVSVSKDSMDTDFVITTQRTIKNGKMPTYDWDMEPTVGVAYIRSKSTDRNLIIHHQIEENKYEIIEVLDPVQYMTLDGIDFEFRGGGTWGMNEKAMGETTCDKPIRLFVPIDLIDDVNFNQYVAIKEHGTTLLLYSKKVVETSYLWTIIALVAAVAICAATSGLGCNVGYMILASVVSIGSKLIADQIGGKVGLAIRIAGAVATFGISGMGLTDLVALASTSGTAVIDYYKQIEISKARELSKEQYELEASQGIQDALDAPKDHMLMLYGENMSVYFNFIQSHLPPAMLNASLAPLSLPATSATEKIEEIPLKSRVIPG